VTTAAVVPLHPVRLSDFTCARRAPVRPTAERGELFAAEFDDDTFLFDLFDAGGSGAEIMGVGPPLFNLEPLAKRFGFVAQPGGAQCAVAFRTLDRTMEMRIEAFAPASSLKAGGPLGDFTASLSPSGHALFAGRRVLFTLSKNNPLPWIQDWIRYHRDIHGCDAVLIYDNGSTDYDVAELAAAIGAVRGLQAAAIVPWPFKYGPQGSSAGAWDSDFCQLGMLEHARWRFLQRARSALNADIDELVVGPNDDGVFAAVERSPFGVISYYGYWLFRLQGAGMNDRLREESRHRDFVIANRPRRRWLVFPDYPNQCRRKYAIVPRRCPQKSQWRIHAVSRWPQAKVPSLRVSYRHFQPLSTNWRYRRDETRLFDPAIYEVDSALKRNFDRVDWRS
jgi:hypothetical protein